MTHEEQRVWIIPPQGMGQIGIGAVVMLNGLPVHESPDSASAVLLTLESGQHVILLQQSGEWAECSLSDSVDAGPAGWVETGSLLVDPAWYMTEEETPVYAWGDTEAPRLDVLEKGTLLPILKDDGEWLVISLRGASAWILKSASDLTVAQGE